MSGSITGRIAARFSDKVNRRVASTRSGRWDLKLADYKVISEKEARIMVAYAPEMGAPKRSQVDSWTTTSLNGHLRLSLETLRHYPDLCVVTAVVARNERLRPFNASPQNPSVPKGMIAVASTRFMDEEKVIWEVMSNKNGERYLSRATKDDLDEILRERQTRERTASIHHRLRLADLVTAGIHNLEPGDKVRFSYEGILQQGEVSKVGKDNVTIKANGTSVTVDRLAVVDVYEKSPKSQAEQDKFLKDFFERAYGDKEFADKLVDTGSGKK